MDFQHELFFNQSANQTWHNEIQFMEGFRVSNFRRHQSIHNLVEVMISLFYVILSNGMIIMLKYTYVSLSHHVFMQMDHVIMCVHMDKGALQD